MAQYETDVQAEIMVEATRLGHRLERNNVGVAKNLNDDGTTRYTRYGVGGKGGSDLVGWTQVAVNEYKDVFLPVYTAVECKRLKGKKLAEQIKRIEGLKRHGCIAGFCFSVEDYRKLIGAP